MDASNTAKSEKEIKMIRRSASASPVVPMSQKSEAEQKSFYDRFVSENRPSFYMPSDEIIVELKKCIDQGSYVSDLALSFLSGVK
jgi:hypothetical protein